LVGVIEIQAELFLYVRNSFKTQWVKANPVDGVLFESVRDKIIEDVVLFEPGKNDADGIEGEICDCQGRSINCLKKTGYFPGLVLLQQEFKPNVGVNQIHQLFHQFKDFF